MPKIVNALNLNKNELQNPRFQNLAAAPSSPAVGQFYYDTTLGKPRVWNGTSWLDMTGVVGGAGALTYQGVWNASTNTPTLTSGAGTQGHFYKVSVAGATTLDGINEWKVGDMVAYNGTAWDKIDNTDQVASVAGKVGTVTLVAPDIGSGIVSQAEFDTLDGVTSAIQTQINARAQKFSVDVGDGVATAIVITHNLNTRDVMAMLRDKTTHEFVEPDWEATTLNTVTVRFSTAPTAAQFRATILG